MTSEQAQGNDRPGTRSQSAHGVRGSPPETPRVHYGRAPPARPARQPDRGRSAARLRRQHGRAAQEPDAAHHRADPAHRRRPRGRHPAHARLPARDPARHPACAVLGQEGSHRRQRAGRDLRREGLARGVLPAAAGHRAPRRGQLHLARHHQDAAGAPGQERRPGRRAGNPDRDLEQPARQLHPEPERAGARRQDRSADRPRQGARARGADAVPPPQEQPAAGRRSRRRQDRDRRGPRAAHRRGQRARPAHQVDGVRARHGRAARRHEIPRRLRAAPEGGAQAAGGQSERDPLHRRDPYRDRRRARPPAARSTLPTCSSRCSRPGS